MRSVHTSSRSNACKHPQRTTRRAQPLQAGLGNITAALCERAGQVLRQLGVKGMDGESNNKLQVTSITGIAAAGSGAGGACADVDSNSSSRDAAAVSASNGSTHQHNTSSGGTGPRTFTAALPGRIRAPLKLEVRVVDSISKVPREEWDAVVNRCGGAEGEAEVNPFLLWSFLHALEESGSADPRTGWLPQHIIVRQLYDEQPAAASIPADSDPASARSSSISSATGTSSSSSSSGRLVGCVPLYLKGHSYGEYVFDHSWADFASMLGVRYYPKLQAAVPFTPVTGPRLLIASEGLDQEEREAVLRALGRTLIDMAESLGVSGVHLTFSTAREWAVLGELGFKQRLGIQFHWENNGYGSFDDFLADLKQSKRKSIRQERKSIAERSGLVLQRLAGPQLRPAHWDRFHAFYTDTADRKWGTAYLTREFFHRLGEGDMAERVLLVVASEGGPSSPSSSSAPPPDGMVAAALNLVGSHCLFGRHWGQDPQLGARGDPVRHLHFELCYYQALEEAINRRLPRVEAGAQGEHKLQRGYLPSFTYSCHYLIDPRMRSAVDRFLQRERSQVEYALQMVSVASSPYKKDRTVGALLSKLRAYRSLDCSSSLDSVDSGGSNVGSSSLDVDEPK